MKALHDVIIRPLILTEKGILIRMNVSEIRRIGRATQGVRLIRLDEGDRVVSVAVTGADEDDNNDNGEGAEIAENPGDESPSAEDTVTEESAPDETDTES